MMRSFIAMDLQASARRHAEGVQAALRDVCAGEGWRVRWVDGSQLHLTLRFLGDVAEPVLDGIGATLDDFAGWAPIPVRLGALGAFRARRRPSVLWLGLTDPDDRLARLVEALELRLERFGFPRETRPYHPHVTLGRVRHATCALGVVEEGVARSLGLQASAAQPTELDRLTLYESRLGPMGPAHQPRKRVALTGTRG